MIALWWVRRDLRLQDNPVLAYAERNKLQLLPVYVHAPDEEAPWQPGAASNWWYRQSLEQLADRLKQRGTGLIVRHGPSDVALGELAAEVGATYVLWNRLYEPAIHARDQQVASALELLDISTRSFAGHLLREPHYGCKSDGSPYRVFTPYWKAASRELPMEFPLNPVQPRWFPAQAASVELDDIESFAAQAWQQKLAALWSPGETGALSACEHFIETRLDAYAHKRDFLACAGTSQLSAALHFGELSVWRLWDQLNRHPGDSSKFRTELGWREFAHHLLWHYPDTTHANFNPRFDAYPWQRPAADEMPLRAWQQGRTGIHVVDAAMHQLWDSGWMHNRARMLCGSLLCKNLAVHWQEGARWFWDTLVDADLANNTLGWQWVAGSGADAAPFFRIFNPDTQAGRFDPHGTYQQRWLAGDEPRPAPIVDLKASRARALAAYKDNCAGND